MEIINELLTSGANITAYDPQAMNNAKKLVGDKIKYADDAYQAIENADVLAILTEWPEFKSLDLTKACKLMKNKNIVDCRNMLNKTEATTLGFSYSCIGYDSKIAKSFQTKAA